MPGQRYAANTNVQQLLSIWHHCTIDSAVTTGRSSMPKQAVAVSHTSLQCS